MSDTPQGMEQLGLSRNCRRLLRGLESRGVELAPLGVNYHIGRNLGQGMMNKAAGEIGPTWHLLAGPMMQSGRIMRYGSTPTARHEGESFHGVESFMPLTWILKHDPRGVGAGTLGQRPEPAGRG